MVFSWFAHTGLYVTPVEARKEEKTKKNTLCKTCFFFVVCPYRHLCQPCGSKERGKNEKTTLCKTWFFLVCPYRPMSPLWKQGRRKKRKKTHFVKRGFFVVCPHRPLCHPCGKQGRPRDKSHQTSAGPKKTKALNFKVHETCTGTKKLQKTLQFTWEGASIPLKFCFLSPCSFAALWSSKPNALLHVYCDILYFHCLQIIVPLLAFL